jgi:hypothetical protein
MQKSSKILKVFGITLTVIIVIFVCGILYSNFLITRLIKTKLNEQMEQMNSQTLRYDEIRLSLMTQSLAVYNLYYSSDTTKTLMANKPGYEIAIEKVLIQHIDVLQVLRTKDLNVRKVIIKNPHITAYINENSQPNDPPIKIMTQENLSGSRQLLTYIAALNVQDVKIENGTIEAKSLVSELAASSDSIDITVHNLCYTLADTVLTYNDSIYDLQLSNIHVCLPTGNYELTVNEFSTANAGNICINDVHVWSPIPKTKLADRCGKIPVVWIAGEFSQIHTSPCNIIRQILQQSILLDTVSVTANKMHLYRDNRYPPKEPYKMPQEILLAIAQPINITHFDFKLPTFVYQEATTNINCGELLMHHMHLTANHIKNSEHNVIGTRILGTLTKGGYMDISLNLDLNKYCTFDCLFKLKDGKGAAFEHFIRPLFGATLDCDIQNMNAKFTGNKIATNGTFTMAYKNLKIHVYKEETPIAIIAKNSGAVNFFSKIILPTANPAIPGQEPRSYTIYHKHDSYKNFPSYLLMTLAEGAKETLLPGFYLKYRIKQQPQKASKTKSK